MSAFSSFHQHHLIDSLLIMPNSQSPFQTIDQSTKVSALGNVNDSSTVLSVATNKNSSMNTSSTVTHKSTNNKRKCRKVSSAHSKDMNGVPERKKQKKTIEREESGPLLGYIHVRARRGQATDSHSLAERVRREKISERMKLLQSIVPGCDKVTGKAPVLDQIINYVQSLQNQVQFLSMKLEALSPFSYDFAMEPEPFMVSPDQNLPRLPSQRNPTTVTDDFLLLDDSVNSLLFHEHTQFPDDLPELNRVGLEKVDDQMQNIVNQPGFSDNLFHSL